MTDNRRWMRIANICLFGAVTVAVVIASAVAQPAEITTLADHAQPTPASSGRFIDRVFRDADGEHKYVVFVPAGYDENEAKRWPVILFLHGAGERGRDGRKQTTIGLGPIVKARAKTFPFFVVFPQCEDESSHVLGGWLADSPDGRRALEILDAVTKDFRIDPHQQILTGWSMGGYGTWSLAAAHPKRWHAVVPVAGGGDPQWARKLKDVPIWAFHGAEDAAIRPEASRKMIEAIRAAGGRPRYTEVPGIGHDVWKVVYSTDELYQWLLNPQPAEQTNVPLAVRPGQKVELPEETEPFVPAVEIPNAVFVRLGNDALDALAYSVPLQVPEDLLTGSVEDFYDYTTAQGRTFSVAFTNITYSGQLTRARVKAYAKDRLNIQLGLENVQLTIGATYVTGQAHSAAAGPITVWIGHQGPVWLSFDVRPYVEKRRLRLELLSTEFEIPWENFYVAGPAGVSVRGFGMTRSRVANGLVEGIYGNKSRIEEQVKSVVPTVLEKLEEKLELAEAENLVQSFWPLPVYKPRVRLWPAEVVTDEGGVSLTLGVTAAAIKPEKAPKQPKVVTGLGRSAASLPKTSALKVGVAPGLLGPLTNLLIESDVARIHVKDIPEPKFAPLADPKVLADALPDLKRFGEDVEVWSELVLAEPLEVRSAGDPAQGRFTFVLPKLLLSVAVRKPGEKQWKPYAEFTVKISQTAESQVVRPDWQRRALRLAWVEEPQIRVTGRFAPGYTPKNSRIDVDRIRHLFEEGWHAWTAQGPFSQTDVPDLEFGVCKLRLEETGWFHPYLFIDFAVPTTRIINSTDVPVTYEVKGPYGSWGGPYVLNPGKTHRFQVAYPLTYRRITETASELYTLPVGSTSEFRTPEEGGSPALFLIEQAP
ncbi:MAG: hypothetical protein GXP27_14000, partial [Planctomycetes bacterium]|nr:hypothetical protein [Planctomycetota bacterium]